MTSTFHTNNAEKYERLMGRWSRHMAKPFAAFAGVTDGERLLDVGCGTGSLTYVLREMAPLAKIVGIDVAEGYLEFARARGSDPSMTFRRADATEMPFGNAEFDRALSLLVLQFIPESGRVISELRRVVRPGGVAAACVWDNFGGMPYLRLFYDIAAALGYDQGQTLLRPLTAPGELEAAWRGAGFIDIAASSLSIRLEFHDFADYWSSLASGEGPIGQMIANLGTLDQERLRECVQRVYLSNKPDGFRSFAATAWVCRGRVP